MILTTEEKIQLSMETWRNSMLAIQHREPHGASFFSAGCLAMEEVQRSSRFDVREACVGLAAAGGCAEVSRATTFCWKHTHTYWGLMSDVIGLLDNYRFMCRTLRLGEFVWTPELVRDWQDLDFTMSERRLAAAIQPSFEVFRLRTSLHDGTQTQKCCYSIAAVICFIS